MKIGRIILTYREDLILPLKEFYLSGGRTEFLVLLYNQELVEGSGFAQQTNFRLEPYRGTGPGGNISGQQFTVWKEVVKKYPEIEAWVIHDYDLLAKPKDAEIFKHVPVGSYGSLGKSFASWQKGMNGPTTDDIFPYPYHYVSESQEKDSYQMDIEKVLLKYFPVKFQNISTIMTGYTDFLTAYSKDLLLLDNASLSEIKTGGLDQVVHTMFAHNGLKQEDLRQFFSSSISLDDEFEVPFKNNFDFSHPVKFWPSPDELQGSRN